jgi:hypothetical protein
LPAAAEPVKVEATLGIVNVRVTDEQDKLGGEGTRVGERIMATPPADQVDSGERPAPPAPLPSGMKLAQVSHADNLLLAAAGWHGSDHQGLPASRLVR